MRLVLAMMQHETNTFSPVPTPLERFARGNTRPVPFEGDEALEAFQLCTRLEGIIPALEPSHALAHVMKIAPDLPKDHLIVMNLCGRGDKDVFAVAEMLGVEL